MEEWKNEEENKRRFWNVWEIRKEKKEGNNGRYKDLKRWVRRIRDGKWE